MCGVKKRERTGKGNNKSKVKNKKNTSKGTAK